jgi:hypothetical protein
VFFDRSISTNALVLVAIKTPDGIRINEFNYFNYAARTKIIPPATPSFYEVNLVAGE